MVFVQYINTVQGSVVSLHEYNPSHTAYMILLLLNNSYYSALTVEKVSESSTNCWYSTRNCMSPNPWYWYISLNRILYNSLLFGCLCETIELSSTFYSLFPVSHVRISHTQIPRFVCNYYVLCIYYNIPNNSIFLTVLLTKISNITY